MILPGPDQQPDAVREAIIGLTDGLRKQASTCASLHGNVAGFDPDPAD